MRKDVATLASELNISPKELLAVATEKLELPIRHSEKTPLTEDEVDQISHYVRDQQELAAETEQKKVKAGVIRRRIKRGDAEGEDEGAPEAPAVAAAEALAPAEAVVVPAVAADAAAAVEEVVAPGVVRPKMATVTRRRVAAPAESSTEAPEAAEMPVPLESAPPEDLPLEIPAEAVALEESVDEPAQPKRSRFATVVTREMTPDADIGGDVAPLVEGAEPPVAPVRPRMATVVTRGEGGARATSEDLTPVQIAALERKKVDLAAQQSRGGARVVGTVNPEILSSRMGTERRDAGRPRVRTAAEEEAAAAERNKKGKKGAKRVVQSRELYDKVKKGGKKGKAMAKSGAAQSTRLTVAAEHKRVVRMEEAILISEIAHQMGVKAGEIVMKLAFELGMRGANINTTIDYDTATLIAEIYGYKVEQVGFDITKYLPVITENEDDYRERPPVVTVMGHVDHGKTSLLDAIRDSAVTSSEAGGITQHVGAYLVSHGERSICFLDTPGHEAFSALRARGAKVTDLVVLVVAADDGVMPQTIEAINHAKAAEVPVIVAINKIDKPSANPDRIRQALTEFNLVSEEWGGDTIFVEISALKRIGIDALMEMILLQSEVLELQANPNRPAEGVVIESRLDIGRGPVATILVQKGTLRLGETVVIGQCYGRVRTMTDEFGVQHKEAKPSMPVELTGLNGVPDSGESFYVVKDEKDARTIAEHVAAQHKQAELAQSVASVGVGMERIAEMLRAGEMKELKVIVKADVQGSAEALKQSLAKLSTERVSVRIIHAGVGSITESDVNLAASSDDGVGVVIIGFNTKMEQRAQGLADQHGVTVLQHSIIYEVLDQVRALMAGLLEPVYVEEYLGRAEIRKIFQVSKVGMVAGCMVVDGVIQRNAKARVVRGKEVVVETGISSLRHFERDEREVKQGFECGISLERSDRIQEGDFIECYRLKATQATL